MPILTWRIIARAHWWPGQRLVQIEQSERRDSAGPVSVAEQGALMACCRPGCTDPNGPAIMLSAGAREGLFDTGFDVAFRLTADGGQLGDNKIARAFEHTLLAKGKWLEMTQIGQMLKHGRDFKDVASAHPFREVLKSVLPIVGRRSEIIS